MTVASATVPNGANNSSSSASVVSKERFPTKKFHIKKMICANAAAQPFPGIGFQITNEEVLTDDLPCYEQKNKRQVQAHLVFAKNQGKVLNIEPWSCEIAAGPKQT